MGSTVRAYIASHRAGSIPESRSPQPIHDASAHEQTEPSAHLEVLGLSSCNWHPRSRFEYSDLLSFFVASLATQ
jgi:hypothetical protein